MSAQLQIKPPDLTLRYAEQYAYAKPLPINRQEFLEHLYLFAKGVMQAHEELINRYHDIAMEAMDLQLPRPFIVPGELINAQHEPGKETRSEEKKDCSKVHGAGS